MATSNPRKNKRILDRQLSRAFTDLNKILPQKEIAEKFRIKKWQVSAYKKPKKRKPFDKRKRKEILDFYRDILTKKPLYHRYDYRVVKGRVHSIVDYTMSKTKELQDRIEIKELARIMGVKPETIQRWRKGRFIRLKHKTRERLWQAHKKYLKTLFGLFFVCKLKRKKPPGIGFKKYCYILYFKHYYGSEGEFEETVRIAVMELRDSLIGRRGKFEENETIRFLENLKKVDKEYLRGSIQACREFVKHNFKGAILTRLLKMLGKYEK